MRLGAAALLTALIALELAVGCHRSGAGPEAPRDWKIWSEPAGAEAPDPANAARARGPRPLQPSVGSPAVEKSTVREATPDALDFGARSTTQDHGYRAEVGSREGSEGVSPFHRFAWNRVENPDGSITQFYYFRANNPGVANYVDLMKRFVPGFSGLQEGQDYWTKTNYLVDPRQDNRAKWHEGTDHGLPFGGGSMADLLIVTAPAALIEEVDQFLAATIAQVPQVEIEVTIVEIAVEDALQMGIRATIIRGTEDSPARNLFDSGVIDLAKGLVEGTFGTFSAIQDETTVQGLIELFQGTESSNVLSAPKLAVLNGHRAVIDTGSKVPVFTPTFNAAGITSIKTTFKPTGIQVVVTPLVLSADTVQLDISILVSAVTGFVTAGIGSGAEVNNPLLSKRNAYTVVNVPSGQTVLIGGLTTTDEILTVDKVPVLGDIPFLGALFRRKEQTHRRTQVLFLVKPHRIEDRFRGLYDPGAPTTAPSVH